MRVSPLALLLAVSSPVLTEAQVSLRCGPAGRGHPAADGSRCECNGPLFVEQVAGGMHRCVPAPRPRPTARRAACPAGMVPIPGGEFWMGSADGVGLDDERPRHRVQLSPYCIDRTEVTVAAYRACVDNGACPAATTDNYYTNEVQDEASRRTRSVLNEFCNWNRSNAANHPINCITWAHADAYCRFRGGRLPTEAEWEFAARGTDERRYPWGGAAPDARRLNVCGAECARYAREHGINHDQLHAGEDGWVGTAPVGSFPQGASPYGALDLAGNVSEWVADWWSASYPSSAGTVRDPSGPDTGDHRVGRGSSWVTNNEELARASHRMQWLRPTATSSFLGFRCARSRP